MTAQTGLLFGFRLPPALYVFVFSGSVCSYNFHWYLTPPGTDDLSHKLAWNLSNRRLHFVLFLAGLAGAAVSALLLFNHWLWLGLTAFLTFLYSAPKIEHPLTRRLRKIAVGKTIFLAAAWMHVTSFLPLLTVQPGPTPAQLWYGLNRFFFLYAICVIFDRRDVDKDREAGIKSLVTYFSAKGVDRLFWASLLLVFATALPLRQNLSWSELAILLFPALLVGLLYHPSKKNTSDYLYYFLLDGLMALSAPMLILAKFAR